MDPEDCLRSLAASALRRARLDTPLFPVSLGLMAVANAFVMLGLLPEARAEEILAAHRLALEAKGFGEGWGVTKGELTVRPGAHEYWQARTAGGGRPAALREVPSPAQDPVPTGTCDPPWPTPAECYLAALAPVTRVSIGANGHVAEAEAAEIVATVADSLMAVGALPGTSALLREPPAARPDWVTALAHRWGSRVHYRAAGGTFAAAEHPGLPAWLPLEHATAVIESVRTRGDLVGITLYGHPWVHGEYWPMITPCFQVRATDDEGIAYEGMPGEWQWFPGCEGRGAFWLWPPGGTDRERIRVTVSTLWEAAWADIELPRRVAP